MVVGLRLVLSVLLGNECGGEEWPSAAGADRSMCSEPGRRSGVPARSASEAGDVQCRAADALGSERLHAAPYQGRGRSPATGVIRRFICGAWGGVGGACGVIEGVIDGRHKGRLSAGWEMPVR